MSTKLMSNKWVTLRIDFPLISGVLISKPVAEKHFIIKVNNVNKNTSISKQVPRLERQDHAQDLKKVNFHTSLLNGRASFATSI